MRAYKQFVMVAAMAAAVFMASAATSEAQVHVGVGVGIGGFYAPYYPYPWYGAYQFALNRVGNNVNQMTLMIRRGREAEDLAVTLAELRGVLAIMREAFRA